MGPTQKLLWKLYVGVIGAVTTIAAQRLLKAVPSLDPPPGVGIEAVAPALVSVTELTASPLTKPDAVV